MNKPPVLLNRGASRKQILISRENLKNDSKKQNNSRQRAGQFKVIRCDSVLTDC